MRRLVARPDVLAKVRNQKESASMRQNDSQKSSRSSLVVALGLVLVFTLSACQIPLLPAVRSAAPADSNVAPVVAVTPPSRASQPAQAQPAAATQDYTAKLQIQPAHAPVGATVAVVGSGYTPGANVNLVWYSASGSYLVQDGSEFVGERFTPRSQVITTVAANSSGNLQTQLNVPVGFGGSHDLRGQVNGKEVSQSSLMVDPTFSLTPREGPVGTPVELKIVGVDSRTNVNTWHVLYDNHYLGFMSAVTTNGTATAHFRIAGPVGDHQISVWHNSINPIPYLNFQQGPFKDVPVGKFQFNVTSDRGLVTQQVEDFSATDNPWPIDSPTSGNLQLTVDRGTVGQATTLHGSDLPANAQLTLRWWTMIGNRVSNTGFSPESRSLGTVQTGADGTLVKDLAIPDDLGGQHRLELLQGDKVVAATGVVIEPSIVSVSPTTVQAGDTVQIHLKGVGWTTYENTYAATYDDSYIGYVCGFSTNGDVQFSVIATGAPGTHLIDLYPTIYKGQDAQPKIYSIPQLTYASDHPVRITPAIRMTIEITK